MKKLFYISLLIVCNISFFCCVKQKKEILQTELQENIEYNSETIKKNDIRILFSINGLYGYLDDQFNIIVPPIYMRGFNFTEHGYALVYYDKAPNLREARIIDIEGK